MLGENIWDKKDKDYTDSLGGENWGKKTLAEPRF